MMLGPPAAVIYASLRGKRGKLMKTYIMEMSPINWGSHYRQFTLRQNSAGYLMVNDKSCGPMGERETPMDTQFPDLASVEFHCIIECRRDDHSSFILDITDESGGRELTQFAINPELSTLR